MGEGTQTLSASTSTAGISTQQGTPIGGGTQLCVLEAWDESGIFAIRARSTYYVLSRV
jgi:hypothetical protein